MSKMYFSILCLIVLSFTSCQFSETIYINEDGSGKMEFGFNGSELMMMVGDNLSKENEEAIDSIMSFKDFLHEKRDSIAQLPLADQEKLKALEPFSMHMVMNPETKEMKFDLVTDFTKVNELQDMFDAMNKVQELDKKSDSMENPFAGLNQENTELKYDFDGVTFTRNATVVDKELHNKSIEGLKETEMMFSNSKYKLNYHFPKKIKSVSNENAMFSADHKSLTLEFGFMEYIKNPEALNITVILED